MSTIGVTQIETDAMKMENLSRRKFLSSACAVVVAPVLPVKTSWLDETAMFPIAPFDVCGSMVIGNELKVGQLVTAPGIPIGMRIVALISSSIGMIDYVGE